MVKQLQEWFAGLAPRERVMVSAAAVVVVFALFYYALWRPLNAGLADARTRTAAESDQARWMLGIRDEARQLQASGRRQSVKGQDESLLSIVDASSRANDLGNAVRRIQPANNDKATVTLDNADFNQLVFWLRNLQSNYGIRASEFTASRQDKPGTVQARLTLVRGAS